jgi:hypothetical protein
LITREVVQTWARSVVMNLVVPDHLAHVDAMSPPIPITLSTTEAFKSSQKLPP